MCEVDIGDSMGRGRKPDIPIEVKNEIKESIKKSMEEIARFDFVKYVIDKTKRFENEKQTWELLAEVASLNCVKDMKLDNIQDLDFSEDAKDLIKCWGGKDEYQDPDASSIFLYLAWGKFLVRKGILNDFKIVSINYSFALQGKYKNEGDAKEILLASDGISTKNICANNYEKGVYKKLGSFLIWPRHEKITINQKKGIRLGDSIEKVIKKLSDFYTNHDMSFVDCQIDIDWLTYIGNLKKEKNEYDSFMWCFQLENLEFDSHGIFTKDFIKKRNRDMCDIINKV